MTTKRKKDPAGLLPDQVTVELAVRDESGKLVDISTPEDLQELGEMLEFGSPAARIDRLREHSVLQSIADSLAARLAELGGTMDHRLDADIVRAESRALYLSAAPAAIETKSRNVAKLKHTNAEINAALKKHNGNRTQAARSLKPPMRARSIRRRIQNERELAHWRKT